MNELTNFGLGNVHVLRDEASGLHGVIVLDSTVLGPAAGGCRLWSYESDALMTREALRLAAGMSYKNAMADLPLGGGKAVLQRPRDLASRRDLFLAFGRAVESLGGTYVTAEDVGSTEADMLVASEATRHVAGLPRQDGRPGGDPSPWTASGVFQAMEVAVARRLQRSLRECTVAIQGVGSVGAHLARLLHAAGAKLVIADVDPAAAARVAVATGAEVSPVHRITRVKADVFAPCALGGSLNAATVPGLMAAVVCGAANNQLATVDDGVELARRGILYAPDYIVNAGGIINVAAEYLGWSSADVAPRVAAIAARLDQVLEEAERRDLSTAAAADAIAQERIDAAAALRRKVA